MAAGFTAAAASGQWFPVRGRRAGVDENLVKNMRGAPGLIHSGGSGGPRQPRGRRGFRVRHAGGGQLILRRGKEGRDLF